MSDYSLKDAAARLGTTTEAVRARIRRHSLEGYRDNHGRWRVRLPDDQTNNQSPTQPVSSHLSGHIVSASRHPQSHVRMRERIAFLEGTLAEITKRLTDRDRELAD